MRVAGDYIHQATSLVSGQGIACGSFLHQRQSGFQFGGVLFETLAIQGVALGEVFTQDPRGSLSIL